MGDVAGVSTFNAAAGILGRAAAAGIFADACGLCAPVLDHTREMVFQKFTNWSGNARVLALILRWAKLRRVCGCVAHACVLSCLAVVRVSQHGVCGGAINASRCDEKCFECELLLR